MADGTKVGNAYVEVTPKAAGNFASVLDAEVAKGGDKGSQFGGAFSEGMKGMVSAGAVAVGEILADAVRSGVGAVRDMMSGAFEGFADYQQLSGGMEKLFGEEDAQAVIANAQAAFQTAGMSANEYMEKATSISASLIDSVGGDTEEAARLADVAIRAMSDNYNTFGTDAESVSNAFMGLAKQNYSMLDNLSLGYAGNQQGMLDLINDSGVLGKELTDTSELAEVGFGKMVEAIQAVQEKQNIAGTTFNEYKTTVSGSLDAVGAAWDNWLAALGNPDVDMGDMTDQLLDTLEVAAGNVLPLIERIVASISTSLPGLVQSVGPVLIPSVVSMVSSIVPAVVGMAPTLLQAGMQLFLGLVQATVVMLPQVAQTVMAAGPQLFQAALSFFSGLGQALGQVAPMIFEALGWVITHLPEIIVQGVAGVIDAGAAFFGGFVDGIMGKEPEAAQAATQLATGATDAALGASDASAAGQNLTDTFASSFDFSEVQANATEAAQAATDAAVQGADGSAIAEQLAATTSGSIDVTAMDPKAAEMVESAVSAAKAVDVSSIGAEFSQKAAGGIDTSAMAAKMQQLSGMANGLNATSTVSVKADLSGVSALQGASNAVAAAYRAMAASVESSMGKASRSAATAAASVKGSMAIPDKTVFVHVARGSVQLPHFSMSGNFDPKTKAVPTVNVSWWAKGAIFDQPTIFANGVGERGPEAVMPIDRLPELLGLERNREAAPVTNIYVGDIKASPDSQLYRLLGEVVEVAGVTRRRRS